MRGVGSGFAKEGRPPLSIILLILIIILVLALLGFFARGRF